MTRNVDTVIVGTAAGALAAVVAALRDGLRVLVVLRAASAGDGQRFRRRVRNAASPCATPLTVLTNVDVVCVDGIGTVEAVVLRHVRTGRLAAVGASAFLSCDG